LKKRGLWPASAGWERATAATVVRDQTAGNAMAQIEVIVRKH